MRVPIGVSDFRKLMQDVSPNGDHYFYCDKSKMIEDLLNDGAEVILFTRPRRFGKTLNMSMLSYFFGSKEPLFNGLEIAKNQHIMDTYHGQYPVIFISFKGLKHRTYDEMLHGLSHLIRDMFELHKHLFENSGYDVYFDRTKRLTESDFGRSLLVLSQKLYQHYDQRVLILIDEYDAPIQTAYINGYYDELVNLMRNLFEDGLKDNKNLFKGVLTGITRVAKANLFSGLNHFFSYDIDALQYSHYFGFTENDVIKACGQEHMDLVKEWYNGYTFGKTTIYNPWSILYFMNSNFEAKAYWIDTAENALIQKSLTADKLDDVKTLIDGGTITLKIDNNLILRDLEHNSGAFFNLLYTSGYLTAQGPGEGRYEKVLRIPNKEVREFFESTVVKWFGHGQGDRFLRDFLEALIEGNWEDVQIMLTQIVQNEVGIMDATRKKQESFYHGLLLGITLGLRGRYKVRSNRESGHGYCDLALSPNNPAKDPGVIIEIKTKGSASQALDQISNKSYTTELKSDGCTTIHQYGIKFDGKRAEVKLVTTPVK